MVVVVGETGSGKTTQMTQVRGQTGRGPAQPALSRKRECSGAALIQHSCCWAAWCPAAGRHRWHRRAPQQSGLWAAVGALLSLVRS